MTPEIEAHRWKIRPGIPVEEIRNESLEWCFEK